MSEKSPIGVSRFGALRCITGCEDIFSRGRDSAGFRHRRSLPTSSRLEEPMTYFSKLSEQHRSPKLIGFVGFDGVTTLDLTGPLEAFANARLPNQTDGESCYETIVISAGKKTFVSQSGVVFKTQHTLGTAPQLDTIIVPGGAALRDSETGATIAAWLQARAKMTRR